jgi:L-histidine N-alpha-methyltransferase
MPDWTEAEAAELLDGLRKPLPELSARYFYDDRGSELFEQITQTPEYYPTRTELLILQAYAAELIERTAPKVLAELGSGVGKKIQLLIRAGRERGLVDELVMFDINRSFLDASVEAAEDKFPGMSARGIVGDFGADLEELGPGGRRLLLFLAGTVGNLHPDAVPPFLTRIAALMTTDDWFLLGVDLVKDHQRLHDAYNDADGVTAAFNLNVLHSLQQRFGAEVDVDAWEHRAFFDPDNAWIEMRLAAKEDTVLALPALGFVREFAAGDELRTELSCKYTQDSLKQRLQGTGLVLDGWYTDPDELFALALLRRDPDELATMRLEA